MFVVLFYRNPRNRYPADWLVPPLEGVVIFADIGNIIGPLPQLICYRCGDPGLLCKGSSAFLIVDLTFHGQWDLFQARRQPPCTDGLAFLGNHPSLVNRTGAAITAVVAKFKNSSPKLCSVFGRFVSISLQQR